MVWELIPIVAAEGEVIECPACGKEISYSRMQGWRDAKGFNCCNPGISSSHGHHIDLIVNDTKERK